MHFIVLDTDNQKPYFRCCSVAHIPQVAYNKRVIT